MKINLFKKALSIMLLIAIISGCNQTTTKNQSEEKTVENIDVKAFKNQINTIIQNTPKGVNMVDFINEVGASYIYDLTLPMDDVDKYETKTRISLSVGAYAMDMFYANTYNRVDVGIQLSEILKLQTGKLGIQSSSANKQYMNRISQMEKNSDSLNYYLDKVWNNYDQEFAKIDMPETYALIIIGGNIEAMYLLSQLTLYAKDNRKMLDYFSQQVVTAKNMLKLLEILSVDESIKPYMIKMKPIADYFATHQNFTIKQLDELAPMIESIRNEMFN
jgi:hypothetical protein